MTWGRVAGGLKQQYPVAPSSFVLEWLFPGRLAGDRGRASAGRGGGGQRRGRVPIPAERNQERGCLFHGRARWACSAM